MGWEISKRAFPPGSISTKKKRAKPLSTRSSKVERSTRTIKESSNSQNTNTKWNVTVEQNIPNDQANAKPQDQARKSTERKEQTDNFELSSKTTTTVSDGYRIESIAVAVVVNRKPLLTAAGDKPGAVEEQIKSIEQLVASAAGLQPARGDKATVVAVDFAGAADLEPIPTPLTFWDRIAGQTGNYLIATAILVSTILFISIGLRPSLRLILDARKPALPAPEAAAAEAALVEAQANALPPASQIAQPTITAPPGPKRPSPLKQVEQAIEENEEQAAEILKLWINEG